MAGTRRFAVSDHVHVASIGKGVVREVRNGGRYLVDVKGRQLVATDGQLTPVAQGKERHAETTPQHVGPVEESPTRSYPARSIDLHGMTTDEAVASLDVFLSEAILEGTPEVRVIHGRSGGRLKASVHARLKLISSVRGFHLDRSNPGVTVVSL